MLKGMWCHKRPLSTGIIHSAADFSANNGRNFCHCSLYTSQMFFSYSTSLLPQYTVCPCCRSLNNEMFFGIYIKILLMIQHYLWSGWAWLEKAKCFSQWCAYISVFCSEAADSRIIQEDNAGAKTGERNQSRENFSLLLNFIKNLFKFSVVLKMKILPCLLGRDETFLLLIKS